MINSGDEKMAGATARSASEQMSWADILYNGCVHISIFGFILFIFKICCEFGLSLVTAHVFLMSFGFFVLMTEAILCFTHKNILTINVHHQDKIRLHWILQTLAGTCILLGFLNIYINKNLNEKPHFTTYHSYFGLTSIITMTLVSIGGIGAKYSFSLKQFMRPIYIKILHSIGGLVAFVFGAITILLALYSHWFGKIAGDVNFYWCWIIIIFVTQYIIVKTVLHLYEKLQRIYR